MAANRLLPLRFINTWFVRADPSIDGPAPMMKALFVSGYDDETLQHYRINLWVVLQRPITSLN